MQIGQLLVEQRWIEPAVLARALAEQRHTGKRICSLLIARGLLDPDHAARALATQHGVAGVLQRHLENRDRTLARLLPAAIARACFALPIGRTRGGELIVCVRDPNPALHGVLGSAVGGPVVIAVAPASRLEQLIGEAYANASELSVDVDLSTRPIAVVHEPPSAAAELDEFEVDLHTRPIAVFGPGELGELGSITLVGLDDDRVAKDPSQSGQLAALLPRTATLPLAPGRTQTSQPMARSSQQLLARTQTRPQRGPSTRSPVPLPRLGRAATAAPDALAAALAGIERAATLESAIDSVMSYVADQFGHAVLFAIQEGAALGDRGHGGQLTSEVIQAITIPLHAPSVVQTAHRTRQLANTAPANAGVIQDRLSRLLGSQACTAVPVEIGGAVAFVLAVGDRLAAPGQPGDPAGAERDLARLASALGEAADLLDR